MQEVDCLALDSSSKPSGLNIYNEWIVLARVKDSKAKVLIQTNLLAKALRDVVYSICRESNLHVKVFIKAIVDIL